MPATWEITTAAAILAIFIIGPHAGLMLIFRWPLRRVLHNPVCNRAWAWPHDADCDKCDTQGWPNDPN